MSGTRTVRRTRILQPLPEPALPDPAPQRRPVVPLVLTAACIALVLVVLFAR